MFNQSLGLDGGYDANMLMQSHLMQVRKTATALGTYAQVRGIICRLRTIRL